MEFGEVMKEVIYSYKIRHLIFFGTMQESACYRDS